MKGWAGWIPRSENEKIKFQDIVLCSGDGRDGVHCEKSIGLVALQEPLEDAALAVMADGHEELSMFTVQDEITEMAAELVKCRDTVRRKLLRKRAREARTEFDAGRAALPRGKVIHKSRNSG